MKSDKNLIFADIVYFGLIYPSEKKRENSNGKIMSTKVCQRFLYPIYTLVINTYLTWFCTVCNKPKFSFFLYASRFFKDLIRTVIYIFLPIAVLYVQSFPKLPVWHATHSANFDEKVHIPQYEPTSEKPGYSM